MQLVRKFRIILLTALLFLLSSGCAERGTHPPIIHALGSTTPPTTDDTFRVATANLWGVAILGFDWADAIDERFAELAVRLGNNPLDFDVVLIQEAWKDSARLALLHEVGVARNFPYRVDTLEAPGGGGLVILSRFPIESAHFHRFEAQGNCGKFWEGDCLSGKGLLLVQVRLRDQLFWIADTHLIACYAEEGAAETECDQADPNSQARERQIIEIRRILKERVGDDPVILGGDLNFTRTSHYYGLMTSAAIPGRLDEATPSRSSASGERAWTEPGEQPLIPDRVDYLFTRSGDRLRWHSMQGVRPVFTEPVLLRSGRSVALSDHPILMGTFCLVRTDDPTTQCLPWDAKPR